MSTPGELARGKTSSFSFFRKEEQIVYISLHPKVWDRSSQLHSSFPIHGILKADVAAHLPPPKQNLSCSAGSVSGQRARTQRLGAPGMGVGSEIPCRRFTFMEKSCHEDTYGSKARASSEGKAENRNFCHTPLLLSFLEPAASLRYSAAASWWMWLLLSWSTREPSLPG
jgi:hypothetical protein